ncbi:MAG: nucleotidyltransferase family protein [Acidobacteriota bacterium]|nr:nucleotidyltransferase family protein [Blastocatellia bacterium]MDW8240244.1 nucleotidyltransferase family protein [Acidobacteriota bacterium]
MITAILLAAGESRRMGQLKQLLPFGSKTVIETCLDALLASKADHVMVVLGHRADEIGQRLESLPVTRVINPDYRQGMSSSVKAGVRRLPPETQAVMIALVDQPLVPSSIMDEIMDAYRSADKKIVVPEFQGRSGHPIVIDLAYRDEILAVNPQAGLRELIYRHWDDVLKLPVQTEAVIDNMNTWDDYQRLLRKQEALSQEAIEGNR